ncbi:MAG: 2-C-methyl-D-erythritol 2,4-cyclodiphosphate synthase [Candidatus Omnitrophica bacterium]|nr:2-C-methyl-D-erythritol 2,4-cyclodiphosphate synthase [Candidatus Omnitrophota bacterium]
MKYRVGIGYDIHRLKQGRRLFLGGIEIPHSQGLVGHSDGDVLLHALTDALLGALSCGDIGKFFPDTDPQYKGISSTYLLEKIYSFVKKKGYRVNNIDTIVIAQQPRLENFKEKMAKKIAEILKISPQSINIKAKTNEGLGLIGRNQAVVAYAVVSLIGEKKR